MISKKDAVTLGMLAIGGVGAAMVIGGGDGGAPGALEGAKARAGGILGAQEGYGAPAVGTTIYSLPAQPSVTFPKAPSFDLSALLAPQEEVVSRGAAGVSAAPKKWVEAGTALGYEGYKMPIKPTPIAPPYIPGVTTFIPYEEPAYVPSPVKKYDYMGTGMTQSEYKSKTVHRTYSSPTTSKKTSTDASKAISHAKRLRAGRGD